MPQSPSGFRIRNILPFKLLKIVIIKFVNDFCVGESTPIAAGRCPSRLIYSPLMSRPIGSTHGGGRVLTRVNYFLSLVDGQTYNNGNNNITHQLRLLRYLQRSFSLSLFWFFIVIIMIFYSSVLIELAAALIPIVSNDIILHRDRFS